MATSRVHVLIIEIPGYSLVRIHAEAAITARGWVLAAAPADADVLLVCGEATGAFVEITDSVWNQIPSPRHRTTLATVDALAPTLNSIPAILSDQQRQLADARQRPQRIIGEDADGHGDADTHHSHKTHHTHDGHDHAAMEHNGHGAPDADGDPDAGMGMGGMDMGADAGMDMGGMDMDMHMDMSGPAGIPLASGDESDRDGLEMDVTHLTLGPVLPDWPAGLVVHCTLHGDVIGEAAIELLPGREADEPPTGRLFGDTIRSVELCDAAGHLLAVAGWEAVELKIRRVRDELLTGSSLESAAARLNRASRQIARSLTLRWSLAGIAKGGGIDARARLLDWLRTAAALLAGEAVPSNDSNWPDNLDDVRSSLIGQELSTVRLLIACIEPSRLKNLVGASHG
ncbi:hypothetical protein [Arthrobacter sp. STN4]|uniref:hypothetical protein n=1 Tax=Arthrobacter sp. STN4 TaxID=2923276 RepID=UPI002119B8E8|nr:hypothetical protein [Arthrobacter sp. STN4]MCQ9164154.1 hypothetical protein [Arthrobacter sp. STN4]